MRQKEAIPIGNEWVDKNIRKFSGSPFERINSGWMLITSGTIESDKGNWNTMTASWGGLGELWGKDVAFIFVRPSRHTFGFMNSANHFTLSFFDEAHRAALNLCGEKSGRDTDKAMAAGLTPVFFGPEPVVSFKEASDIIVCRKLYTHDINPAFFLDAPFIETHYKGKDYHRMFIGEITAYKTR